MVDDVGGIAGPVVGHGDDHLAVRAAAVDDHLGACEIDGVLDEIGEPLDDGRVAPARCVDGGTDQFGGGDLPAPDQCCLPGGVEREGVVEVSHGANPMRS